MTDDELIPSAAVDEPDTGKTLSALKRSRGNINQMLALFGGRDLFPSSIMVNKRVLADPELDGPAAERRYTDSMPDSQKKMVANPNTLKALKGMARGSGVGSLTGALSKFFQGIGRSVVLLYSEPGDTIVDPFSGHNSRMELSVRAGRHYIGCDLTAEFVAFNRKRAECLRKRYPRTHIEIHHCDSRKQPIGDAVGDMTISSPPYWDIEQYGNEPEQMSNCRTYEDFMASMELVLAENFRTLKPGAFACFFINDFRKDSVFRYYHIDLAEAGERVGFEWFDIIVIDLGRGIRDCFVNQAVQMKVLPKRHEYCIVLRKPPE
jgi:SAM-dependent methyltransferase